MKRFNAFTLAEVLITLGIIGVVAALTMPVLIANHQEKQTVVRLKKAYSVISQAYLSAKNEYGQISDWFTEGSHLVEDDEGNTIWSDTSMANSNLLFDRLGKYLNVASRCKGDDTTCQKYEKFANLNNVIIASSVKTAKIPVMNLADGTTISGGWINNPITACKKNTSCADFAVDINGITKGPNTYGKDIFIFSITPEAVKPVGGQYEDTTRTFENDCNISENDRFNGYGCTAWVIFNENMDYLHCPDKLGWDKATSCK